jgi:hypothetical protein
LDVSLPGIYRAPAHIVVVPIHAAPVQAALRQATRAAAAATFLKMTIGESDLLFDVRDEILFEAARRMMEVSP